MFLYHATPSSFRFPDYGRFEEARDFGPALYCTDDIGPAIQFAKARYNHGHILRFNADIDHLNYTHVDPVTKLSIYVFDYRDEQDIIAWMRQVIGNRIVNTNAEYFQYIMDKDIYVGYRADGDLEKIIEGYANTPNCLHDEPALLEAFYNELLEQYVFSYQVALTTKACEKLIGNFNPLKDITEEL